MATKGQLSGEVVRFDDKVGLGVVVAAGSGTEYPFHCTAIADGSRVIEAASIVLFHVAAAHGGRYEAIDIHKV